MGSEPDEAGPNDHAADPPSDPESRADDELTWAVLIHVSGLSGLLVPFGNVVFPLTLWLIKRDESEFLDASGKAALNFQLTWTVLLVGALLSLVVGVGLLLVPLLAVAWLVLVVVGTARASEGEVYDYPLTLELIG
jgi:hypothetical protein